MKNKNISSANEFDEIVKEFEKKGNDPNVNIKDLMEELEPFINLLEETREQIKEKEKTKETKETREARIQILNWKSRLEDVKAILASKHLAPVIEKNKHLQEKRATDNARMRNEIAKSQEKQFNKFREIVSNMVKKLL